MHLFNRGGTLILGGVAASFLFLGCQSTNAPAPIESEPPPMVAELEDLVGEVPEVEDMAGPSEAELREIEEALLEQANPKSRKAQSLEEQVERMGASIVRGAEAKQWRVSKGDRVLVLTEGSRNAQLDGIKVLLDAPLGRVRGKWLLSESDERIVLGSVFGEGSSRGGRIETIAIDPGHGGSQVGTRNDELGILEKEMTLDVSLRLKGHLEGLGYKTILTRYDDRQVELVKRSEISNGVKADLFVSVHFNWAGRPAAEGVETFMLTPAGYLSSSGSAEEEEASAHSGNRFDVENFRLALEVQKSLVEGLGRVDRGVKKARFAVLKGIECPGILAECGFVSNGNEGLLITTAGYRERVAQALADAIVRYAGMTGTPES